VNVVTVRRVVLTAALMAAPSMVLAQEEATVPSHCVSGEAVFLSAKMKRVIRTAKGTSYQDTGKILSLCADKPEDPIGRLSYRYGPVGKVEMERVATTASRFGTATESSGPRSADTTYFFEIGNYGYYISVASGMASGVGLDVYQNDKRILELFSGTDSDVDFFKNDDLAADAVLVERQSKH